MMLNKLPVTVTIITKNESLRLEAAIRSVSSFAEAIVVVDSNSTDDTVAIAERMGAQVHVQAFLGFGQQKNFAQSFAKTEWVLNLDADERVTPELEKELRDFFTSEPTSISGIFLPRKTWYLNRWVMHGGWYPNYLLRLSRRSASRWSEPHLHESLQVEGATAYFKNPLEHYSFPNQRSHILKNIEYAAHASLGLKQRGKQTGLLDLIFRPIWKFLDGYVLKCGFLDGFAGLFIAIHSAYATFLRYTYLYEQTTSNSNSR